MYQYTYGVTQCPECLADLTHTGAVAVELATEAGSRFKEPALLRPSGELVARIGYIEGGLHSDTRCAACGQSLADWEALP